MKSRKTLVIGGALFLILTYIFWPFGKSGRQENASIYGVPATVIELKGEQVEIHEDLPGRVVPYIVAEIRPQVSGIITDRLFEEGSEVREGQPLYQINAAQYEAAYNSAKANLAKAEANVKLVQAKASRYETLLNIEAISKQEYDDSVASLAQAEADVAIAKAAMETAKINLDYTKVYAPISGRIGKSSVTKGALVTANQTDTLATITQLDPVYVDIAQAVSGLMRIKRAISEHKKINIELYGDWGHSAYAHPGLLQFPDITVDQTTGSVQLRALFPNPENILLPGAFIRARIKFDAENIVLIPQKAAIRGPDGKVHAWIVDKENKVAPVEITVGEAIGDKWLVKEGVKAGDVIVLEGFQKLMPGALISPAYVADSVLNAQGAR